MEPLIPLLAFSAIILFAAFFSCVGGYSIIHGFFSDAPFVPSSRKKRLTMIELADIKQGDAAVDLGCGNGSLLIEAAKKGAYATGIESNPFLTAASRMRARIAGLQNRITIIKKDLFQYDLGAVDIVFLYLSPHTLEKLKEKLEKELKPGARVISNTFPIPGWTPKKEQDGVFLYIKDEKSPTIQ